MIRTCHILIQQVSNAKQRLDWVASLQLSQQKQTGLHVHTFYLADGFAFSSVRYKKKFGDWLSWFRMVKGCCLKKRPMQGLP
jgi:hypothetical protein